jgi:hypothetical protein
MAKRGKTKATPKKKNATKARDSKRGPAGTKARKTAAPRVQRRKSLSALKFAADSAVVGACMVPDSSGGPSLCQQLDQATCARRGGVFIGGPC